MFFKSYFGFPLVDVVETSNPQKKTKIKCKRRKHRPFTL